MTTPYERGIYLERLLRTELRQAGFLVIRAAGSRGPIDLVAINGTGVLLIQVKAERQASRDELAKLIQLQDGMPANVQTMLAERRKGRGAGWRIVAVR